MRKSIVVIFHILTILLPLTFLSFTDELFEFNKIVVVYAATALIVSAWLARMIQEKRFIIAKTPFRFALIMFVLSQLASTLFSMHPWTSWLGYYSRFNGGLASILCYGLMFYAFISNVKREEVNAFLRTTLVGAFLSALYAIPEHFGHSYSCLIITGNFDVACWIQDVRTRIFGTFGQPNWLAAYAIMLFPIALHFTVQSWKKWISFAFYGVTSFLLLLCLAYSGSRSGTVGIAIGLTLGGAFLLLLEKKFNPTHFWNTAKLSVAAILVTGAIIAVSNGTIRDSIVRKFVQISTPTPSAQAGTPSAPKTVGTQLDSGGTESSVIRAIVWEGAIKVWKRYPIFGSGVETFAYSYYKDRPKSHNLTSEWDFLYNKAHNEFLNYLATTGAVGFGLYLFMSGSFFWYAAQAAWKSKQASERRYFSALIAGMIALHVSNFFGFSTVAVSWLFYLFPAFVSMHLVGNHQDQPAANNSMTSHKQKPNSAHPEDAQSLGYQYLGYVTVFLTCGFLLWNIFSYWRADVAYAEGMYLEKTGNISGAIQALQLATQLSPNEAVYHDELAYDAAQVALQYAKEKNVTGFTQSAQFALAQSELTAKLNPVHVNFFKSRARVLLLLAQLQGSFITDAIQVLEAGIQAAPTDPKLMYNLALVYQQLGNTELALQYYQQTEDIYPNFSDVRANIILLKKQLQSDTTTLPNQKIPETPSASPTLKPPKVLPAPSAP